MAQGELCRQQPRRRLRVTAEKPLESQIGKLEIRNKCSGTATWAGMACGAGAPAFPFAFFFYWRLGGMLSRGADLFGQAVSPIFPNSRFWYVLLPYLLLSDARWDFAPWKGVGNVLMDTWERGSQLLLGRSLLVGSSPKRPCAPHKCVSREQPPACNSIAGWGRCLPAADGSFQG